MRLGGLSMRWVGRTMLVPVVVFAQVLIPDGTPEESLNAAVERALAAVRASVDVVGWEIVREGR